MKKLLTIAGSDSSGGGGIQSDLKTFAAFGVYGASVITAVTAQNSLRIHGITGVKADFVGLQFESVLSDMDIDGVKTGMLYSAEIVLAVSEKLRSSHIPVVVIDPVMKASDGSSLLDDLGVDAVRNHLIPDASLVTPNIPEAEILSGVSIRSLEDICEAAKAIHRLGCGAVLVKGGHFQGDDAVDILYDGEGFSKYISPRIKNRQPRGTGCTYSAAILASWIQGNSLKAAVREAKVYITEAIRYSFSLGKGAAFLNLEGKKPIREKNKQ